MIIISGSAYDGTFNYHDEYYSNGKEIIKKFPILYGILKEFPKYTEKYYGNNTFLNLASCAKSNVFLNDKPNPDGIRELERFEKVLFDINLPSLNTEKRNLIIEKMNSFNEEQNKSITQELDFYFELKSIQLFDGVIYDNFEDSNHDFRFNIDGVEFNVEITRLGMPEFQVKLTDVLNHVSESLLEKIPLKKYLKVDFKSDMLPMSDGKLDCDNSYNMLLENCIKFLPIITIENNNLFHFESNFGDLSKTLWECRDMFRHFGDFGKRLIKLSEANDGREYLKKIIVQDLHDNPIVSIIYGDSSDRLIEIHTECIFPSTAEELRQSSLMGQLKRKIIGKIQEQQLLNQINPFFCVEISDAILFTRTLTTDIHNSDNINKLKNIIIEGFQETNNTEILGVLVYDRNIKNSFFVKNPTVNIDSNILERLNKITTYII